MPFGTQELATILTPLGFTVDEVDGFIGNMTQARRSLGSFASRWSGREDGLVRDLSLFVEVWPNGIASGSYRGPLYVVVSGQKRFGMQTSGPEYVVNSISRLRSVASDIVQDIEQQTERHLCPKCGSLLVRRPSHDPKFFGCAQWDNPNLRCNGTRSGPVQVPR